MVTVVTWKWQSPNGPNFSPVYVNRLQAGLKRHLHLPHELVCITDDPTGLEPDIRVVPMPTTYEATVRCRRRMQQFDKTFSKSLGERLLYLDLDVVITDDLTPLIDRPEPIVCWKVGYANVYSGSILMADAGALDGAWQLYHADPAGYPKRVQPRGVPSDQAMLNHYLKGRQVAFWTERDGIITYFGEGYEKFEHLGVGPTQSKLPRGARLVVLGSADKAVMDTGAYPWIVNHWSTLTPLPILKAPILDETHVHADRSLLDALRSRGA